MVKISILWLIVWYSIESLSIAVGRTVLECKCGDIRAFEFFDGRSKYADSNILIVSKYFYKEMVLKYC